jgi:hypothetical protein
MNDAVAAAVAIMIASPESSDAQLAGLVSSKLGGNDELAWLLVELLPCAFASIITDKAGVRSTGTFVRLIGADSFSHELPFTSLPQWLPCLEYARLQASIPIPSEQFFAIAGRSAELATLSKMYEAGADPNGASSSPTVFLRSVPASRLPSLPPRKPWWKWFRG